MKNRLTLPTLAAALLVTMSVGCGKPEAPVPTRAEEPAPSIATASAESTGPTVKESFEIGGAMVETEHSALDGGRLQDLFDGNRESLARTQKATVMLVDLTFPSPKKMSGLSVTTGSMNVGLRVFLASAGDAAPVAFEKSFRDLVPDPTVTLDFGGPREVKKVRIEIANLDGGDGHVHVREVQFM